MSNTNFINNTCPKPHIISQGGMVLVENYEYNNFGRSYPARHRPTAQGARRQAGKKTGRTFFITGFQAGICVLCLSAAVILRLTGGSFYQTARNMAQTALKKNITVADIQSYFKNLQSKFPRMKADSSGTQLPGTNKQKTTGSSVSTAAVTQVPQKNIPPPTNMLLPPSYASLGPVKMNIKPVLPVSGHITSIFGYRVNPVTKKLSFHPGIDIAAPKDTPIQSAFSGTVQDAGKNNTYGNYLLINNGNSIQTFYGHCDIVLVKQGDKVTAGEIVAKVGTTGMSTGCHVHFEIRVAGKCVNPQLLI